MFKSAIALAAAAPLMAAPALAGPYVNVEANAGWTCLLYTSPSPRDQRGSRMPSSA